MKKLLLIGAMFGIAGFGSVSAQKPTPTPIEKGTPKGGEIEKGTPTPIEKGTPAPIEKGTPKGGELGTPTPSSSLTEAASRLAELQRLMNAYQAALSAEMKVQADRAMGRASAQQVDAAHANTVAAKQALDAYKP